MKVQSDAHSRADLNRRADLHGGSAQPPVAGSPADRVAHAPEVHRVQRTQPLLLPLLVMILAALTGCDRGADPVEFPPTPVISARESWAVVRGAYVRIQSEPSAGSAIQGHVRRGAILAVSERTPFLDTVGGQRNHWLAIVGDEISGWIFGAFVETYTTFEQAQTAARSLRGE